MATSYDDGMRHMAVRIVLVRLYMVTYQLDVQTLGLSEHRAYLL